MRHKIDKIKLQEAVLSSFTIAEVLVKLGIPKSGSSYSLFDRKVKEYSISIDHFTGQAWSKGRLLLHGRNIDDYLSNRVKIKSNALKKYLIELGLKECKCENCTNDMWMGRAIPLELHHIDGNNENNNLTNLQVLCPNCHALTENYRKKKNGDVEQ
jgi:hypothetical protein